MLVIGRSRLTKIAEIIARIFTNKNFKKKTLEYAFIRLDLLGDNFIFFPFLLKYKQLYPNSIWIVNKITAPLYRLLNLNYITVDLTKFNKNPFYRFRLTKHLLSFSFKHAINIIPHRTQIEGDEILKILNAKEKICYFGDFIGRKQYNNTICDKLIKFEYKMILDTPYIHIFNHEKNFFEKFTGLKLDSIAVKEFYLQSFLKLKQILNQKYSKPKNKYLLIIPDASSYYRKYPREHWQYILDSLPQNLIIIQLGLKKFPLYHKNLIDLTGKTSLEQAMFLVMNASLVIGNETGLTHLAYLSGIPTICILGGGHYGRFLPWEEFRDLVKWVSVNMDCFKCGWICKYVSLNKDIPPCISNIHPKKVLEAIVELDKVYNLNLLK